MAAGTLIRTAMLKITADDGDTEAKLDEITRKAKELAAQHPELTAKVNTAAASAKLKVLKQELQDTGNQSQQTSSRFGALGSALNLFATGGLSGGISEMTTFQKVMAGLNIGTGLAEPLVAGLTVAAGGLADGFLAAGAGVGAFGLVAKGVWAQVSNGIQNYQKAQAAVAAATTKSSRAAALKQEAQAMDGLSSSERGFAGQVMGASAEWQKFITKASPGVIGVMSQALMLLPRGLQLLQPLLGPVESALGQLVDRLQGAAWSQGLSSFVHMLASNAGPAILKIGTAVGHIVVGIGGILKAFMPVQQGMLSGVDRITGEFAKWGTTLTSHSGFKDLMSMFKQDTPLAMNALKSLGGILKTVVSQMTGMDTFSNSRMLLQIAGPVLKFADALLKAHPQLVWLVLYLKLGADGFGKLKTAITGVQGGISDVKNVTGAVSNLSKGVRDSEAAASDATGAWGTFGGKLSSIGSGVKSAAVAIGSGLSTAFTASRTAIKAAATSIAEFGIGEKIAAAATKVWTVVQAAFDVVMDANPIMLVVIAIAAIVAVIVVLVVKFKVVRDFFKDAWRDIVNWTVDAWHGIVAAFHAIVSAVSGAVSTVINFVKSHWQLIVAILTGPIGIVVLFVKDHFAQITSFASKLVSDVVGWFERLPGRIMSAIAGLPGMLLRAGTHIIEMLAHGIEAGVHFVTGAIGHIASEITSHLPFSPAKKGPLSGRGSPDLAGMRITQMLAGGMTSQTALVEAGAVKIARAAMVTASGGGAGGAGGLNVQIGSGGSSGTLTNALVNVLRKDIRVNFGGDVQRWAHG